MTGAHQDDRDRNVWDFYTTTEGGSDGIRHRWRCSDLNGEILFISSQSYARLEDAERCARRAGWKWGA